MTAKSEDTRTAGARAVELLKRRAVKPNEDVRAYAYSEVLDVMTEFAAEQSAALAAAEAERDEARKKLARIQELARGEHSLLATIVKRLQEIGHISDHPDTNLSGAIHGVINGYLSYKASTEAAEAKLYAAAQEIAALAGEWRVKEAEALQWAKECPDWDGANRHELRNRAGVYGICAEKAGALAVRLKGE